jgi:rhamnosyl/mannosyltransferase
LGFLKVLHSYKVYRPDVDGGIPFVVATLTGPGAEDIENEILVARGKGFASRYHVDGVPVEAVTSLGTLLSTPLAPSFPFTLARRARSCDIVVHHSPFPLADVAMSALPANVALIVYWHADIVGFSLLKQLISPALRNTLRRADRIIVADRSTIESSTILRPFADKCTVIPYGVDVDYWTRSTEQETAAAERLRKQFPRMVLAIGRLVPYKGFGILLQALQQLDAQAVIIGEGPLEQELKTLANELGVAGKVHFAGRLSASETKAHVQAARVLAFPSVTSAEAFGIVQLEAMAAGVPIVNTALGTAVPRIARDELEALTVAPNDPQALATALRRILEDPSLRERLGHSGRERARAEFSHEAYLSKVRSVYQSVLKLAQARHPG